MKVMLQKPQKQITRNLAKKDGSRKNLTVIDGVFIRNSEEKK